MDSEIWGVIEMVMGYRIIYLKRWPPDITAFKKYRCPGPAPDLLSQNLGPGSRRGTGSQCSWSKPADRKGAWGLAVADWSKSWVKIFSPTALAGGPKFFFFHQARTRSWGRVWDHFCFPWLCQLCLTGRQVVVGAQWKTPFASSNCRGNFQLDFNCSFSNMHKSYLIMWTRPETLTGVFLTMKVTLSLDCSKTKG